MECFVSALILELIFNIFDTFLTYRTNLLTGFYIVGLMKLFWSLLDVQGRNTSKIQEISFLISRQESEINRILRCVCKKIIAYWSVCIDSSQITSLTILVFVSWAFKPVNTCSELTIKIQVLEVYLEPCQT